MVVLFAITLNTEHEQSHVAVVGNYRCVESGVDVVTVFAHKRRVVLHVYEVARRLFRNDVYNAADGICAVKSRTASADNLNAVNHSCRNLLKSVDRCKR